MDLVSAGVSLIPTNKFKSFKAGDICEMMKKYHPAIHSASQEQQFKHFVVDASNDKELKKLSTLTILCHSLVFFLPVCHSLVEGGRHSIYKVIDRLLDSFYFYGYC